MYIHFGFDYVYLGIKIISVNGHPVNGGSSGNTRPSGNSGSSNQGSSGVTGSEPNEIVNKHNQLRRSVQPSASNMLKMVTS